MSPYVGEFLGTLLLILLGDGLVAGVLLSQSKAENAGWLAICIGWGLAVTMSIYAVGQYSGAHINPAVTLAFAVTGAFPWAQVPAYVAAQIGGAIAGAFLVWLHYRPHWSGTSDAVLKLAVFCTVPAVRSPLNNFISEVIATMVLALGLLFIGANKFTDGLNPIVVGALITAIGLALGGTTGFAINPARDFGPRVAHAVLPIAGKGSSDWGYAWIPIAGPLVGGVLGALVFMAIF